MKCNWILPHVKYMNAVWVCCIISSYLSKLWKVHLSLSPSLYPLSLSLSLKVLLRVYFVSNFWKCWNVELYSLFFKVRCYSACVFPHQFCFTCCWIKYLGSLVIDNSICSARVMVPVVPRTTHLPYKNSISHFKDAGSLTRSYCTSRPTKYKLITWKTS